MVNEELSLDDLFEESVEDSVAPVAEDAHEDAPDPADQTDAGTEDPAEQPDQGQEPAEDNSNLTAVERYLSDYGIVGGRITYEDGTSAVFDELPEEEKYTILQSLAVEGKTSLEKEYDLDKSEIGLLNAIRESKLPADEFISTIVNEQVEKSLALRDSSSLDYNNMPDDAVFLKWLQEVDPAISQEEALEKLERQKEDVDIFKNQVNSIRDQFIDHQNKITAQKRELESSKQMEAIEEDRNIIVNSVEYIDNIGGAEVTDQMKNEVLHSLLEVNNQGDPLIMEEMFSDPERLFKAAWFMKYGESYMNNVDKYWRRKESEAYKKGREDIISGAPDTQTSMSRNDVVPNTTKAAQGKKPVADDVDALWD